MKEELSSQVNRITTLFLLVVAFLTPLFLSPLTTDFYEAPKLIFLTLALTILLLLKGISWVLEGRVLITRTPFDLPLILFLLTVILSSVLSSVRDISFFGNLPKVHGSALSWVVYILFYFLAVSHLKTAGQVKSLLKVLVFSGVVASIVSILSYFGLYLPFQLAKFTNFTPTGSAFSTNSLIVLLLPVLFLSSLFEGRLFSKRLSLVFTSVFALNLALTADWSTQIAASLGLILVLYLERKPSSLERKTLSYLAIPLGVFVLFSLLGSLPLGKLTLFKDKAASYSKEIQLPFNTSWKISASSFRDAPFLGTGPSTYLFDFTQYKSVEYNSSPFWTLRFDNAFNELLQQFATTGTLGLVAFGFLILTLLSFAWKLFKKREDYLVTSLSISLILGVVLLLLHPSSLVEIFTLLLLLSCLVALNKGAEKVKELTIGIKTWDPTGSNLISGDALPGILLIIFAVLAIFTYFKGSKLILADIHHRNALNAASKQGLVTYNELVKAEQLNPTADLYRTDLAQTNFALARAIAQSKAPSSSSPSGSLTDADKQNIQTLLSQSINEGRAAVTLNPLSAQNWEVLASIYRQISGVAQNALQFSLDSYGRAIQRDPLNPLLRLGVGGVYYSVKNYDSAIRFFTDSINLKPDFANGYYNLAVALRDKGDLTSAIGAAENLVTLIDKKSPDYSVAAKLLSDLKDQAKASSSGQVVPSPIPSAPPAAEEGGALQQKELPKVLNLPQPSSIATPSAINK